MADSRRARAAAVAALVGCWGLRTLGSEFQLRPPGLLYELWYSAVPDVGGVLLAVAVGVVVGRWWVTVAALTPVAVLGALELAGHTDPWHDGGPPLTGYPWEYAVSGVVLYFALPLLFGVSLRLAWRRETRLGQYA